MLAIQLLLIHPSTSLAVHRPIHLQSINSSKTKTILTMTQLEVMSQLLQHQLVKEESRQTTAALPLIILVMDLQMD